jgi:hypothetical protein
MTEQQYTCPYCHKDYTRFTISEHYGCGVEPLETVEDIKQELDSISEEVAIQESEAPRLTEEPGAEWRKVLAEEGAVILEKIKAEYGLTEKESQKPAPKKRGPKPKTKVEK